MKTDMEKYLEITLLLGSVEYRPGFRLRFERAEPRCVAMFWQVDTVCSRESIPVTVSNHVRMISIDRSKSDLIREAYRALLDLLSHEAGEFFKVGGKRVFNPHIDLSKVAGICDLEDTGASV